MQVIFTNNISSAIWFLNLTLQYNISSGTHYNTYYYVYKYISVFTKKAVEKHHQYNIIIINSPNVLIFFCGARFREYTRKKTFYISSTVCLFFVLNYLFSHIIKRLPSDFALSFVQKPPVNNI